MKKGFFYGYVIVFIIFILQIVMYGPRASFGVFIKPITAEFDWTRALVAGAFSLSSFITGFSGIIMGWLNDRLGPRFILTICGILAGVGLMLMFFVDSSWQLYLFYIAIVGPGMGGLFAPQMSTIARWFVKRRNIMTAILMAGGGVGGLIGPPLITWLIYTYSWQQAFLFVGIGVFVLVILAAQFLRRDPYKMGQVPYGEASETKEKVPSNVLGLSLKQAFHTTKFWILEFIMVCYGFCSLTTLVHIVPYAIDRGISPATAAVILAVMNGAVPVSSIIVGLIADRIGTRRVFITCVCLLSAIMFLLLPVNIPWLLSLFVMIVSFGGGGISVIQSSMVAELFGMKAHGAILGCTTFAFTVGGAIGPFIAGAVFDSNGNYQLIFLLCGALVIAAIIMAISLNRIRKTEALA
jgi:MFS family permease